MKTLILCFLAPFILTCCTNSNKPQELSLIKPHQSGYIEVDKGKLFYQKFGSGTPIVVLHGGPGLDQTYLLPQMLELAKDHEVIFYDQRGSGKSIETEMNPSLINIDQFTKDLDALRKCLGLDKLAIIGHSWGGLLAMNYAVTYPNYMSVLILLSTAPADYKGQLSFVTEFKTRTKPITEDIKALFNYQDFEKLSDTEICKLYKTVFSVYFYDPDKIETLTLDMDVKSARCGFKVNEHMLQTSWLKPEMNLFPKLKNLNVATLILHGNEDIVPFWTAQEISRAIPHSQIICLKQCGHFPYIEKPDQLFFEIRKFLNFRSKKVTL